ncbi:serine hydrolase domain-containing protein [Bacteroidota bacterium]
MKTKFVSVLLVIALLLSLSFFHSCSEDEPTTPDSNALEIRVKAILDSVINNSNVPGLVAGIWASDKGLSLVYEAGVSDLDTKEPMDAEMLFRIGSNTKTLTITVLLQLVDEDSLELTDKISKWFPDFPKADSVTIEMITNMRSGIPEYMNSDYFQKTCTSNPKKVWLPDTLINIAVGMEYYFSPGNGYRYSNTNTYIAGRIIEMITGNTLEEEINRRIIEELGLSNTYFITNGVEMPGYHPRGYYESQYEADNPDYTEYLDMSSAWAAGSAVSNLYDLKTYVEKLTSGYFLSAELQAKRLDCHQIENSPYLAGYGMGIISFKEFYGHNGSITGFTSIMMNSPSKKATIILWYNCQLNDCSPTDLFFQSLLPVIYPEL